MEESGLNPNLEKAQHSFSPYQSTDERIRFSIIEVKLTAARLNNIL
jgi:hypothetical protein